MRRTFWNRTAVTVGMVAFTATTSPAQDQLTVMVHGLGSSGQTWYATAARLQQELSITTYTPSLPWKKHFPEQAEELQAGLLTTHPGTPLMVGHSNGGLVSRQLSKSHPLQGIVTVGTPNAGAPFARNLVRWAYWAGSVYGIIGNIVSAFAPGFPPGQVITAVSIADRYGEDSVVRLLTTLGIDALVPALADMSPASTFISELNSPANVAREASRVPTRVGIVSFDPRYRIGGPFRLASPGAADEIGLTMLVAGYVLDGAASAILANADVSDPQQFARALDQMYAVSDLAAWLLDFDDEWCAAISSPTYPYFPRCDASDGIVPYWSQLLPGAPNLMFPGGPIHTEQTSNTHDQLYEVLTVFAHIQPRAGGGDFIPPVVTLTAPPAGSLLSRTVSVSANADDDVGVSRVEFSFDGASIASVAEVPYQAVWDTTMAGDGAHTLVAHAFDAAGNRATASEEVTVINGTGDPPPGPVDTLQPGTSLGTLTSSDGRFHFLFQGDGNLVLYGVNWASIWTSGTAGSRATAAVMRPDGNFVVYDVDGAPVFATNTAGHPGAVLAVQNNGRLVVRSSGGATLWSTDTGQ